MGLEPIGVGTLAMPERQRVALVDLLQQYGRHHPTDVVMIPETASRESCARPPVLPSTATCGKPSSLRSSRSAQTPLTVRPRETPRVSQQRSPEPER